MCHTCNVTGHYNTTCPLNPNKSRAAENRKKRAAKAQGGTPRKRGRPKTQRKKSEEQEGDHSEDSDGNDYESE